MADKQLSRLEQELYSLWEFIENGCDARPEDKHDALSTLDRIKLFFSETREHSITQAASESAGVSLTSGMESGQAGERPAHFSHDKRQDTPRTDAQHAKWRIHDDPYTGMVNHARQLERELAEMTAHADTWMETCRKLEDERELIPSHVAALTPDWCMDAFWRANPGRNAVVPSLYLLDFAREVLRVHGVQSASGALTVSDAFNALSRRGVSMPPGLLLRLREWELNLPSEAMWRADAAFLVALMEALLPPAAPIVAAESRTKETP
jgi:hypothetical protein